MQARWGQGHENRKKVETNDLAVKFSAVLKGSLLSLPPTAVRVAVRGPELTQLLLGNNIQMLELHQRLVGAAVCCPEGAEGFD